MITKGISKENYALVERAKKKRRNGNNKPNNKTNIQNNRTTTKQLKSYDNN